MTAHCLTTWPTRDPSTGRWLRRSDLRGLGHPSGWDPRRVEHVDFFCGTDPVFAGVHAYETTLDGRSYRQTAACCYSSHLRGHLSDRHTTIVLPSLPEPWVVVHELGHALHETIDFDHLAEPVTEYAKTNGWEAFAEALCSWRFWNYGTEPDPATIHLFEELAYP